MASVPHIQLTSCMGRPKSARSWNIGRQELNISKVGDRLGYKYTNKGVICRKITKGTYAKKNSYGNNLVSNAFSNVFNFIH